MDPKSALVKSKSSNSGISKRSKSDPKPKFTSETWSDFPQPSTKKRGVYVEKRLSKLHNSNVKIDDAVTKKPPARPPPGQKKFLNSVLNILSKSTTGTQFPAIKSNAEEHDKKKRREDKNKTDSRRNEDTDGELIGNELKITRNNKKFKSRVLNKKYLKEDKNNMMVLQSKKDISLTPSNNSQWSCQNSLQKSNTSNCLVSDGSTNLYVEEGLKISDDLKQAMLEGRKVQKKKKTRYLEDLPEPKTLVSDAPKSQDNLYNFFVDILEKTVSVCDIGGIENNGNLSNMDLQINESVAKHLDVNQMKGTLPQTQSSRLHDQRRVIFENYSDFEDTLLDEVTESITIKPSREEVRLRTSKPKKLKATSFIYTNKVKPLPQKSKSVEINRKTTFKNKKDFMNELKRELEIDTDTYERPQSIFQALKLMARNKTESSFNPKTLTDECVLKRRKIIPSWRQNKRRNKYDLINKRPPKLTINATDYKYDYRKKYADIQKAYKPPVNTESSHSLEVYEFDTEFNEPILPTVNKSKDVSFTYNSPSNEFDFDVTDAMLNLSSDYSFF